MEIELLHIHHGDKKKTIATQTPEGKTEVEKLFKNLCEQKCAVFLERGKRTYRVIGYDKDTDELIVENPKRAGKKPKDALVGDRMKMEQASRAYCRVEAGPAKLAAVAPVAGGRAQESEYDDGEGGENDFEAELERERQREEDPTEHHDDGE